MVIHLLLSRWFHEKDRAWHPAWKINYAFHQLVRTEGKNKRKTTPSSLLVLSRVKKRKKGREREKEESHRQVDNFDYHFLIAPIKLDELPRYTVGKIQIN